MPSVNNASSSHITAITPAAAPDVPEAGQSISLSEEGLSPEISLDIGVGFFQEVMDELNNRLQVDSAFNTTLGEQHERVTAGIPKPTVNTDVTITIEPEAPASSKGAGSVTEIHYADRNQTLNNVTDTIRKAALVVTNLATTGTNFAINHTASAANIGFGTAAFGQAIMLTGNLLSQCIHAYSGKELPQQADFIANLASAPVAHYMNRPQNDEAVIRACHRISIATSAALALLSAGSNIAMPGVVATSPKLAAAICALATGIMNITADMVQYESDKMKRKEENQNAQSASISPFVSIDIEGPGQRRASV
ncbi:hypothetical protein QRZ34_28710 [Klebsiella michiganensis]|uniref:hypothetical protein n=1 Tax=Klebsiella michiganensis TaxID=1134687 RepID=UPI0025710E4B|nr:hypothetical protein [Klebsiella michiganensis]MDL4454974.1 hypothetical protein [Klebsiella michiganensis]